MLLNPEHTFAILAYQKSPFLEECILSLKKQTVKSNIVMFTSTPSDYLIQISKKYQIPLVVNDVKKGIASDWTYAYSHCKTDFVTLAHQDDIYMPGYTEICLQSAGHFKKNLIVYTDYTELFQDRIRDNNLLLSVKRLILSIFHLCKKNLSSSACKKLMFFLGNPICCPSIMYNRKNIGDFVFDDSFSMNLDWEANLRFAGMEGDFIYVSKKLVTRRIHEGSESTSALTSNKRQEEDIRLFEKFWPKPVVKILLKAYILAYRSNR